MLTCADVAAELIHLLQTLGGLLRYSVYLLYCSVYLRYWYKSTDTDPAGALASPRDT